ncbi:MAG: UDP-2,4-diacetamido-2,4,6-trideoxy-beta-L-altropyranose hydrolase [Candidatus Hydrogenedentes bacterium]|nr:UDP-2,4-diacetamido-2,4,6-trideoxy-beta-L-altropyranose hydrolase [Candidatus Hydrogenedentota bacterium]
MPNELIIRADASALMGTGHVMRCLALGEAWMDAGGRVTLVTKCTSRALLERVRTAGFSVVELEEVCPRPEDVATTLQIVRGHTGAHIVLDGYHFDVPYQEALKKTGTCLLVIDDATHSEHYVADIILNQNLGAEHVSYSCEKHTRLLLGPKYALLRREFLEWRTWSRNISDVGRHLLVTFGGSDPANSTRKAIQAVAHLDWLEAETVIAVGASNPHYDELNTEVQLAASGIQLVQDTRQMSDLMRWADLAVSGGGSTCWELAFMGLPNVIMVLAPNQAPVAEALAAAGVSINLGDAHQVDEATLAGALETLMYNSESRRSMSERGRALVDGFGAMRVVAALTGE